jgi:hypothetical protein
MTLSDEEPSLEEGSGWPSHCEVGDQNTRKRPFLILCLEVNYFLRLFAGRWVVL